MKKRRAIAYTGTKAQSIKILVSLFADMFKLTNREIEVLEYVVADNGKTPVKELREQISKAMKVSLTNVSQQFTALKQKGALEKEESVLIPHKLFSFPENTNELTITVKISVEQ